MEYSINFITIYILLQLLLTLGAYFYYYSYVRKRYLKNKKLPFMVGFGQHLVFLLHALILYLPYFIYTGWPAIYTGKIQSVTGIICGSSGLIILFSGFINLGAYSKTIGINPGKLKTKGLYRITRNPQAQGYFLFLVSFALIWPSWYIILSLISFVIIIHRMILTEEIHLKNVFGEEYVEYSKRTSRYIF